MVVGALGRGAYGGYGIAEAVYRDGWSHAKNSRCRPAIATLVFMKRCWGGHYFASNVGVLPTVADRCLLTPRLVLSIPKRSLGRKAKERRRRLRCALLHACHRDVTRDVAPTIDARTQD